jgi:hypothetical protein
LNSELRRYVSMFSRETILSLVDIRRSYPDQWVAIAVQKTDEDGLPSAGQILVHNAEERFVWSALKLGDNDELVYVFFTGRGQRATVAA